jgi:hypothetical protein
LGKKKTYALIALVSKKKSITNPQPQQNPSQVLRAGGVMSFASASAGSAIITSASAAASGYNHGLRVAFKDREVAAHSHEHGWPMGVGVKGETSGRVAVASITRWMGLFEDDTLVTMAQPCDVACKDGVTQAIAATKLLMPALSKALNRELDHARLAAGLLAHLGFGRARSQGSSASIALGTAFIRYVYPDLNLGGFIALGSVSLDLNVRRGRVFVLGVMEHQSTDSLITNQVNGVGSLRAKMDGVDLLEELRPVTQGSGGAAKRRGGKKQQQQQQQQGQQQGQQGAVKTVLVPAGQEVRLQWDGLQRDGFGLASMRILLHPNYI